MPRKKKKGFFRIPDCLRPSRKKFNFEEVDYDASVWDAPTLQPQDKRRIKYAWLVLHDGRLSHGEISEEFFSIVEEKFKRLVGVYSSYTRSDVDDDNSNAVTRQEEFSSSLRSGARDQRERRLAEKWVKLKNLKRGESPALDKRAADGCIERPRRSDCEARSDFMRKKKGRCQLTPDCGDGRTNSRGVTTGCDVNSNSPIKEATSPGDIENESAMGGFKDFEDDDVDDNAKSVRDEVSYIDRLERQRDKSKQFRLHGLKILESFDRFVKLIDEHQTFMELGFEMRNFHRTFTGIQKAYYRIMFKCIEDTLVRVMDPKIYRKRIRESMIKFMELVYYNTTFQLDNEAVDEDYTTITVEGN